MFSIGFGETKTGEQIGSHFKMLSPGQEESFESDRTGERVWSPLSSSFFFLSSSSSDNIVCPLVGHLLTTELDKILEEVIGINKVTRIVKSTSQVRTKVSSTPHLSSPQLTFRLQKTNKGDHSILYDEVKRVHPTTRLQHSQGGDGQSK